MTEPSASGGEANAKRTGSRWRNVLLLAMWIFSCGCCLSWIFPPLGSENLEGFEYSFSDGISPPLVITFEDDRDLLINPIMGYVWLPKGRPVRYEYTYKGKKISGIIPAVERGEWYMHIGPEGITVNR